MPPYRRYYNYRWNQPWRRQRRRFRRRRLRKPIFSRFRRRKLRVRRKLRFKPRRKLKKLKLFQYQPMRIRKCHIKGIFPLFQAGWGRYSNNYEMYRESYVPEFQPGGGGWSIFQLSLNDLYKEHQSLMNWWTKSNKDYNLVRYCKLKLKFYRQRHTDYVVNYQLQYPFEVGKFHYPSSHPQRLLMFNKKILVPSYNTLPNNKNPYIKKILNPPKQFLNRWYFQNKFCRFPLIMINCAACSLTDYFLSDRAESNNISLFSINTDVFTHKNFRDVDFQHHEFGYIPNASYYMYGTQNGHLDPKKLPEIGQLIYLGDTTRMQPGEQFDKGPFGGTTYTNTKWGNPFWKEYINKNSTVYISQVQPTVVLQKNKSSEQAQQITKMTKDIITHCRYNPFADKGTGNVAKWLNTNLLQNGWETEAGPDLTISGFPLWLLLWGWEDWSRKLGRMNNMDTEYVLVIHTPYIEPKLKAYVFMSESWCTGQGPYNQDHDQISLYNRLNWQPCWQYQKEAIEQILMTGPAVPRNQGQIQAHMHYDFFFKWGGEPNYTESVADPCSKIDWPLPNNLETGLEIQNPKNDPTKEIYSFDIRRNLLTKQATKRLREDSETDCSLFTDGEEPSTSVPLQAKYKKKKKKTQTTKESLKTLQLHLQQLRDHRHQLRHRYQQLTKQLLNTKYTKAESE
nr:MAG: ORF1 [TTV-like mini virus]